MRKLSIEGAITISMKLLKNHTDVGFVTRKTVYIDKHVKSHNYGMVASSCSAPEDGIMFQKRNRHLEGLSEELRRCTRDTQDLQREVERVTQLTLEGIGQTTALGPLQAQPLKAGTERPAVPEGHFAQEGREGCLEQASPQDCVCQRHHSEKHRLHEQQELLLQQAVDRLQTQLQEAQAEREVLAHWSALESRRRTDAQEDLCRKQGALERALREVGAALSACTDYCDGVPFAALGPDDGRQLGVAVEMVQRDLQAENAGLQARLQPLEEQLEVLRSECQEQADRLVNEQVERKQAEAQISVYQKQINDAENTLSAVQAQKASLEQGVPQQRLFEAQAQMKEAQVIRERSAQQVQEQCSQLSQLMADLHQTQEELTLWKEQNQQLCERDMPRTSALDALREELDRRHLEAKLLEVQLAALKQGRRQELEAEPRVLELKAESAALRLKLEDREGTVKRLRLQLDGLARLAAGQNCSLDALQTDGSHMSDQLNQHKLEVQQLKVKQVRLEQQESRATALERELCEVQATLREKGCSLEKILLERQHLANELKAQSLQLDALTEEQVALKQSHGAHRAELENANIHLRAQLRAARSELYHTKRTLKAMDGADRHGLKASVVLQRQITAKRQQIDALQSRVQLLEETVERLTQRQAWVADEHERSQRLASVSGQRRCVETLRDLETQLRDRVEGLETALGKISVRFGECQGHVQQQEQELARLKLQHALDLRELQGQNLQQTGRLQQTNPKIFSHPSELPTIQKNPSQSEANCSVLAEDPTFELHSLVQELRSLTGDDKSRPRRRSTPERPRPSGLEVCTLRAADFDVRNNGLSCEGSGLPETPSRLTPLPQETELGLDPGRRSPVYALLTSSPQISLSVTNVGTGMPPP
ncbi:coiled-coil domain-containing protein 158 isoform X3 [Paramormyrops kingsleyae]|uniref:coiled-coil domain-containing protein 158 isoform X3 n=1 Tax=Paramormyrops kingsleyae TaxID=1676925 RepID=UPI003B97350C